jgi:putative transposase
MRRGFLYLVAIMDWATRKVLAWRVSNTIAKRSPGGMSAKLTGRWSSAWKPWRRPWLAMAARRSSTPTPRRSADRRSCGRRIHGLLPMDGSQFTSSRFTGLLRHAGVRISMDGQGRWLDNVFIERLWRSLKYECVYLHAFETGSELRAGLSRWIGYYNAQRPHSSLAGRTPDEAYGTAGIERLAA